MKLTDPKLVAALISLENVNWARTVADLVEAFGRLGGPADPREPAPLTFSDDGTEMAAGFFRGNEDAPRYLVLGDGEVVVPTDHPSFASVAPRATALGVQAWEARLDELDRLDEEDEPEETEEPEEDEPEETEDDGEYVPEPVPRPLPPAAPEKARKDDGGTIVLADEIAKNAVLITVRISNFGIHRKVGRDVTVTDSATAEKVAESVIRVGKDLIDCAEYDEIGKAESKFRTEIEKRVLPSRFRRGTYLLPIRLLDWFETRYANFVDERAWLVSEFLGVYVEAVEDAKEKLGPLFDRSQYPSKESVKSRFATFVRYESPGVPEALKEVAPELYARELGKLRSSVEEAAKEARDVLRKGLLDLVRDLMDKLNPADGGKRVLKDASLVNFNEFLDLFSARNVTNDRDLAALVEKCRGVLAGTDRAALKEATVKAQVLGVFSEVSGKLETMVEEDGGFFDFSE